MNYGRHANEQDYPGSRGPMEHPGTSKVSLGALLKHHLRDWLWIAVMIVLEIIVYVVIPPFERFVNDTIIQDYRYPHKKETVPTWSILVIAVIIPLFVFFLYFLRRRDVRDFHNAFLGLATAIAMTALFTDSIKNCVGMPRPDFFHRCFPDGIPNYTADASRQAICHPISTKDYRDGYKSFPSGHAAWSFAGLGYLSFYLVGKLSLFDKRGYSSRVFFVLLPLLVSILIGISRVDDYQHRWVDIIAGGLLGLFITYFCYRQHFPSIYLGAWAGYPYEYPPQPIFSHGLHGPRAVPVANGTPNDLEVGRT